ncbi:REST corepressor rcor-1 [Drosophila suzukii]|uniref:REST corepressor rcor-1 n=1 Tax=Drosophila suzukii TaxID=28584 RepID=A0AB39ZDV9_DROSZ
MSPRKDKQVLSYWLKQAATLPDYVPPEQQEEELKKLHHPASILWSPQTKKKNESSFREYLCFAARCYRIEEEQALFILRRQGFDIPLARRRLEKVETARGCRFHRWKAQDLIRLAKAFEKYGTNFAKIHKQLPHLPKADVRLYFYYMYPEG